MKLVNEKGKLFGIINVVDLLALLLVIFVAAAVVYKLFGDRIAAQNEARREQEQIDTLLNNRVKVTYTVRVSTLRPGYYDELVKFGVPQQLAINEGVVDGAYITNIEKIPTVGILASQDDEYVEKKYVDRVDAIITIEAMVPPTEFVKVGSQEVRVGRSYIVKTQFFEMSGIIESLDCDTSTFINAGLASPVLPDVNN